MVLLASMLLSNVYYWHISDITKVMMPKEIKEIKSFRSIDRGIGPKCYN